MAVSLSGNGGGGYKLLVALGAGIGALLLLNDAVVRNQLGPINDDRLTECACTVAARDNDGATSPLKECIVRNMSSSTTLNYAWNNLVPIVDECVSSHAPRLRTVDWLQLHMGRFDEVKHFVPPRRGAAPANCTWLTIGIGGDDQVEAEFKRMFPSCLLYGVEPQSDQAANFGKYGKVLPVAVGKTAGEFSMRVRRTKGPYRYVMEKVTVVPLHTALDTYVGTRTVHFATLDIEGFEYVLLEALRRDKKLGGENVVFCQLDVELHDAKLFKTFANQLDEPEATFDQFIVGVLRHTDYVPVMAEKFLSHRKLVLVNPAVPACRHAFDFMLN